jgi:hypothetical protein
MATDETWTYDGVNLSNYASGVKINDIRTWQGMDNIPGVNVSGSTTGSGNTGTNGMIQPAQTHGEFWSPQYFTAATKLLTIVVSDASSSTGYPTSINQARANYDANLDALTLLFQRRRQLASVVRTLSSGQQRLALVSVMSVIEPQLIPVTQGSLTVELTIPDGFWRDAVDSTLATLSAGFSGVVTGMAGATAPMNDLNFIVTGPVTNPRITDNESGSWVQYNGTVAAGNTLTLVNTTMGASGTGFTPTLANVQHAGDSNWLTLYPSQANGGVNITFGGSATTGATSLQIFGHKKYMR